MADVAAIGLRALSTAAALLAAGQAIFVLLHGALLDRSARSVRSTLFPVALIALALTVLHAFVEPVRLAGSWSGLVDWSLHSLLLSSDFGTAIAIRLLGLATIAAAARRLDRAGSAVAVIGVMLVAASFALMGHTATDTQRWLLAPLLFVHLIAISFWFGSLAPLVWVSQLESPAVAGAVIERFSAAATRIVPAILVAGLAMAALLLPDLARLQTPYGLALLTKLAGFSLLMLLAALNKWRLVPRIARGERSALAAFRISVAAEWLLISAVVAVTAVMTALFSPGH